MLMRLDHVVCRIVNADHGPHAYRAITYMKIRRHPTIETPHPLHQIVAYRTSQVSSEADLLGDPWSGHQSLFGGRLLLKARIRWAARRSRYYSFGIARVLVRLDEVASRIVNADHGIM